MLEMADPRNEKIIVLRWFVAVGTIFTALTVGYVAHYELGLSREEIRTPALTGAAIIGMLMAIEYFGKRLRKPK
jgi:hypothetical protein